MPPSTVFAKRPEQRQENLLLQVERRVSYANGNVGLTEEQRRNPLSILPDEMPAEFRALAMANLRGDTAVAASAHLLIQIAKETREKDWRDNAATRLREVAAEF
jgi:hypothetical protein